MSSRLVTKHVSEFSLELHARGWVANHDGNVSARTSDGFVITPTGVSKRLCPPDSIVRCDAKGRAQGRGRPPSEVSLHVGVYEARDDVAAVMHAHPPYASAFALARRPLPPVCMPEVFVSLGERIPMMPLVLPKQATAAELAGQVVQAADVALMAGNGVLSVGPDLETAFLRLELLEHYCKILAMAEGGIGAPVPLQPAEREYLLELRKKAGLHRAAPEAAGSTTPPPADLRAVVAEEVRRALGGSK